MGRKIIRAVYQIPAAGDNCLAPDDHRAYGNVAFGFCPRSFLQCEPHKALMTYRHSVSSLYRSILPVAYLWQLEHHVAVGIQYRCNPRRHDTGRVILLNNTWPLMGSGEVGTVHDWRVEPACLWTEIRLAHQPLRRRNRLRVTELFGDTRPVRQALPNHLNGDKLDRFFWTSTMAVGAFVLLAKCLLKNGDGGNC